MPVPITDETSEFVTLAEVKRHLNIDTDDASQDMELDLIRGAAQEHVESLIGPVLHRTVTQVAPTSADGVAVLNTLPVVSVTGVTGSGGALTGYALNASAGTVSAVWSSVPVTVTYRAGRDSCPDAVRLATLIVAAHLWQTQLGNAPSALPDDGLQDFQPAFGVGFAMPARAAELLAPYLLLPGVA